MMETSLTPRARAASTYAVSRTTRTEPRTTRATRGMYTTPMATITLVTLGPSEAISAGARMPTAAVTTTRISPTRTILRRVSARSAAGTRGRSEYSRGRATTLIERGQPRERAGEAREPASSSVFHAGIDHQIREVDEQ